MGSDDKVDKSKVHKLALKGSAKLVAEFVSNPSSHPLGPRPLDCIMRRTPY